MEFLALALFCVELVACIALDIPLFAALCVGFAIFMGYGLMCRFKPMALFKMAFSGIATIRNIAIVMLLVGALTALWRACGTIATIVGFSAGALHPAVFLPAAFLLCCMVSILIGTSLGTAATMGVICMTIGNAIGIDPMFCGGAILAGSYFGDRCSPVSTSALLVAEITHTCLYDNLKAMFRTGIIPLVTSIAIYFCIGFFSPLGTIPNISSVFEKYFDTGFLTVLPAIAILALATFRVNVKITMAISIAISIALCVFVQGIPLAGCASILFFGYNAPSEIANMMSGGGILEMLKMITIVAISLTYAGLFKGTGMLIRIHEKIEKLSARVSPFGSMVLTAMATSMLTCNQTLSIILTNELNSNIMRNNGERALALEDTSVVIAPLVPWTVASLIPLGTIDAPKTCILFACYLWLLPATGIIRALRKL